jgi:phosphoribosylamine--glycine ligase
VRDNLEAFAALDEIMFQRVFGAAGNRVVVQRFVEGEECSFIVLTDGTNVTLLGVAQDYKAAGDGDTGPNTGGMGCTSVLPGFSAALEKRILDTIVYPLLVALRKENRTFCGALYLGLMLTDLGPVVLEVNAREGDPETQVNLILLESDLLAHYRSVAAGDVRAVPSVISTDAAFGLVLTSAGYPGEYQKWLPITGIEQAEALGATVFHAGTKFAEDGTTVLTDGGRVLNIVTRKPTLAEARNLAYDAALRIEFKGKTYRPDIGHRALRAA